MAIEKIPKPSPDISDGLWFAYNVWLDDLKKQPSGVLGKPFRFWMMDTHPGLKIPAAVYVDLDKYVWGVYSYDEVMGVKLGAKKYPEMTYKDPELGAKLMGNPLQDFPDKPESYDEAGQAVDQQIAKESQPAYVNDAKIEAIIAQEEAIEAAKANPANYPKPHPSISNDLWESYMQWVAASEEYATAMASTYNTPLDFDKSGWGAGYPKHEINNLFDHVTGPKYGKDFVGGGAKEKLTLDADGKPAKPHPSIADETWKAYTQWLDGAEKYASTYGAAPIDFDLSWEAQNLPKVEINNLFNHFDGPKQGQDVLSGVGGPKATDWHIRPTDPNLPNPTNTWGFMAPATESQPKTFIEPPPPSVAAVADSHAIDPKYIPSSTAEFSKYPKMMSVVFYTPEAIKDELLDEVSLLWKWISKGHNLSSVQRATLKAKWGPEVADDVKTFLYDLRDKPLTFLHYGPPDALDNWVSQVQTNTKFSPENPFLHANSAENYSAADRMAFELRKAKGQSFPSSRQRLLPQDVTLESQLVGTTGLPQDEQKLFKRILERYTTAKGFASPEPWLDLIENPKYDDLAYMTRDYTPEKLEELRKIFRRLTPRLMAFQDLPDPVNVWRGGPMGAVDFERAYNMYSAPDETELQRLFRRDPHMMMPTSTDKNIARSFFHQHQDRMAGLPSVTRRALLDAFAEDLNPGVRQFLVPRDEIPYDAANLGKRTFQTEAEYTLPRGLLQKHQLPYVELGAIKPSLARGVTGIGAGLGLGVLARKHTDEDSLLGQWARLF